MHSQKKSYKGSGKKKIVQTENAPPPSPHHFSNGSSLTGKGSHVLVRLDDLYTHIFLIKCQGRYLKVDLVEPGVYIYGARYLLKRGIFRHF